jgi:hypothetical protein
VPKFKHKHFFPTKVSEMGTIKSFQHDICSFTVFFLSNSKPHKKVHNEELNDLYSSSNIVRLITSRKMRWLRHIERMVERRDVYQYCSAYNIEKNEMGETCRAYGGEKRRIQGFGGENCGKGATWETQA